MLCAVFTSTVAHPLIVLSTWLHQKMIYTSLTLLPFCSELEMDRKKTYVGLKRLGSRVAILFWVSSSVNAPWADGCWDVQVLASPSSSSDFLSRCHTHWPDVNYVLNDIFRGQAAPRCLLPQIGFTGSLLLVHIHCSCYVSSTHQGFRQTGEWYFLWPLLLIITVFISVHSISQSVYVTIFHVP